MPRHSIKRLLVIIISLGFAGGAPLQASAIPVDTNGTPPVFIEAPVANDATAVAIRRILTDGTISFSSSVLDYYLQRQFRPVWSSERRLLPTADALKHLIGAIGGEGLDPDRPAYHRKHIDMLLERETDANPERLAHLDLLLTDAFFALGHDLHYGVAYGADLNTSGTYANVPVDLSLVLAHAAASGEIEASLLSLAPQYPEYRRLLAALGFYRRLAAGGGWRTHAADYAEETNIRERLIVTGDLNASEAADTPEAHAELIAAVKRFQQRHGITADGVVGPVTSAKMAIPPEKLIKKIALNIERWKWFPPRTGGPYIIVNIPGFELKVIRGDEVLLQTRAIVGRRDRETPTFASKLRYMVFNPYWRVPETILKEDLIPKVQANPHYLTARHIKLFAADDAGERRPIDPGTIDWQRWRDDDMQRYVFRMDPGADNPLGYVKFIFPNDDDIYVHDTPAHSLFKNSSATYSSGCIRIRKPLELAHYLLSLEDPEITYKDILVRILSGENVWVRLKDAPEIYITYQTVAVGEDGLIRFYNDIYGNDRKLNKFLNNY